ncbi:MAG: glycosyltransferase [Candidatus Rokubacteria bacterium]|nr:glycosyltransferase [Candidatus Rokubacteria bacterium]
MRPDRIRLLKFVTLFGTGGTERQFVNLGLALDPGRFDLRFGCLRRWGELLEEVERPRLPVVEYRIRSLRRPHTIWEQLRLARDLRRERIDIVHTYNFYANVFAIPAARLARVPVVVASIRDMGAYLTPVKKHVQRFVCRWADCVLVNGEAVRQWLVAERFEPAKIAVIRNGIDLSRFRGKANGGAVRDALRVPRDVPLVAVVARLHPLKGIEYFLEAAAIVARRFPDARFLLVGDAFTIRNDAIVSDVAYRRELERRASRLGLDGRVVFTGSRLDVPELLSEVAVSVLPSLSEGLPNAVLESMAAGVPVVATRVGGTPEAVEDGVTGLLVPPRDAEALTRAISSLLENPDLAARVGATGRERVTAHFSLERMVRETESLYARLLASGSPN